ncbi:hypothetical protein [Haemophilus haemolyticus]|uniref:hypothetical protein n=1 Tax=Haemophilus haemolyticus TaxID=726 RepID=UPI0002EFC6F6|nr:hypothetical protein [Haemophilus haemolyticus]
MFELRDEEINFLNQLDNLITNSSEIKDKLEFLSKKLDFMKMLHHQEIQWLNIQVERQKINDKFELDSRQLARETNLIK